MVITLSFLGLLDVAAENLKKFTDRIDAARSGKSMTLGIIVSSGYGIGGTMV